MLVEFFHSTTTSKGLLKKINNIVPIRQLDLCCNKFVCGCTLKKLTNLLHLDLTDNCKIDNRDIRPLTNLVSLNLRSNKNIGNMILLPLANSLISINVSYNSIINDMTLEKLTELTALDCTNSIISDKSVSCLTNLRLLNISSNETVTDKSLFMLSSLT
jgi:hypothetical protein